MEIVENSGEHTSDGFYYFWRSISGLSVRSAAWWSAMVNNGVIVFPIVTLVRFLPLSLNSSAKRFLKHCLVSSFLHRLPLSYYTKNFIVSFQTWNEYFGSYLCPLYFWLFTLFCTVSKCRNKIQFLKIIFNFKLFEQCDTQSNND